MAESKNKVKTGGADEKPKDEKNLAADASPTPADPAAVKDGAEKDAPGAGMKITGIHFIKGEAAEKKTDNANLSPPGDVRVSSEAVDGMMDDKKKAALDGAEAKMLAEDFAEPAAPPKDGADGKEKKAKKTREARPTDGVKKDKAASIGGAGTTPQERTAAIAKAALEKADAPPPPEPPRDATRPGPNETIAYIDLAELHPFKNHPFQVRDDEAMKNLVQSVKERGVNQPALVRPREGGGYELVAGHRRQRASELAGLKNVPCIVRNMTDDEAILAMTESNFNQRAEILPSEKAQALKIQLDAIKRQGARFKGVAAGDVDKRSNEIVAERNGMKYKTVQRFIALTNLAPELSQLMDAGKVGTTTVGYQLSFLKPKSQKYIAMAIEAETPVPTEEKVKRMRYLEQKNLLNSDAIDGIMMDENKKEDRKVVLNSQELDKYFSAEKTPAQMKEVILKAMDAYKEKQPLEFGKPEKKQQER
jgi:ParB/RepB/Spo0J family partition protein